MSFIVIWLHFFLQTEIGAGGGWDEWKAGSKRTKGPSAYSRADECALADGRQDDEFLMVVNSIHPN
jgi:hypothetical protein